MVKINNDIRIVKIKECTNCQWFVQKRKFIFFWFSWSCFSTFERALSAALSIAEINAFSKSAKDEYSQTKE